MTDFPVKVIRDHYFKGTSREEAFYVAYCTRCQELVRATNRQGNMSWATKRIAVKHAQEHADTHVARDVRDWLPSGQVVRRVLPS